MAIKHVVTRGFGFADNVKFIPTHGFTPGAAPAELPGVTVPVTFRGTSVVVRDRGQVVNVPFRGTTTHVREREP